MATLLYRLGAFAARRRYLMLVGSLLVVATVATLGIVFAGSLQSSASVPGSPAQAALDSMDRHFPSSQTQTAEIVVQAPRGRSLSEPGMQSALHSQIAAVARLPKVTAVSNPGEQSSPDGRTTLVQIAFSISKDDSVPSRTLDALKATGVPVERAGATVLFGGDAFRQAPALFGAPEVVGVLVAMLILLITFGSMLAAGLPLLTAVIGVAATITGLVGTASIVGIFDNAPILAAMLGLAVGIDYALFIVSRHRSQLAAGMTVQASIARACATAGTAVAFAGLTVLIALSGLSVARVPLLTSMGLASAAAVAVALVLALTLLPALLAIAGAKLIPKPGSRAYSRARANTPTLGSRWVTAVLRHPKLSLVAVVVGLLTIAAPTLQLKLALADDGSEARTSSSRQAYDVAAEAFGPGVNGPLILLVEGSRGTSSGIADKLRAQVRNMHDVAGVSPTQLSTDGLAARVQITPTSGPRATATSQLVTRLRSLTREVSSSSGEYVAVTGTTAVSIDVAEKLNGAILPFTVVVVGLALLLLLLAFRSIAIPIKATVGFLLSIGASFGATVAVFQWGWLADTLGVQSVGPIASFSPIITMAVLFGLSMDYEFFLVSSMRENHDATGNNHDAIVAGARNAARVVTAAALIMIAVFVSFLFSKAPNIMPVAFALGVGVLVDAFAVRMTFVPAALSLLGDRAWRLPRWLDRIVPSLDVEGTQIDQAPTEPTQDQPARVPVGMA